MKYRALHPLLIALSYLILAQLPLRAQQSYRPGQVFNSRPAQQAPLPVQTPQPAYIERTPAPQTVRKKPAVKAESEAKPAVKKTVKRTPVPEETESVEQAVERRPAKVEKQESLESAAKEQASAPAAPKITPKPLALDPDKPVTYAFTGKKMICLTYDDGPDRSFTPGLLEYLKSAGVKATFFVCGNRVKEAPELLAQMVQDGHELANHTYSHPLLSAKKISREKITEELASTQELITNASGVKATVMRPPFGGQNATVREICKEMGLRIIIWDIDTEDWRGRSSQQMINNIMKHASDGSIVLMHDRQHKGEKNTVMTTTKAVVPALKEKGFQFVTVSEMLATNAALGGQPQQTQPVAAGAGADVGVGAYSSTNNATTPAEPAAANPTPSAPLPGIN